MRKKKENQNEKEEMKKKYEKKNISTFLSVDKFNFLLALLVWESLTLSESSVSTIKN